MTGSQVSGCLQGKENVLSYERQKIMWWAQAAFASEASTICELLQHAIVQAGIHQHSLNEMGRGNSPQDLGRGRKLCIKCDANRWRRLKKKKRKNRWSCLYVFKRFPPLLRWFVAYNQRYKTRTLDQCVLWFLGFCLLNCQALLWYMWAFEVLTSQDVSHLWFGAS